MVIEDNVLLGDGFFDLERDEKMPFRWATDIFKIYFPLCDNIKNVKLYYLCDFDNNILKINDQEFPLKKGRNYISFTPSKLTKFSSNYFIPNRDLENSNDNRKLSIRVYQIYLMMTDNTLISLPIDKIHLYETSNKNLRKVINISLNEGFYGLETAILNGNISRWLMKTSKLKILNNLLEFKCKFRFINYNIRNENITLISGKNKKKFDIKIGVNHIDFECYDQEIKIICDKDFCPSKEGNSTDTRELGIILDHFEINNLPIYLSNEIVKDNLKDISSSDISFTKKIINNKTVGIICYVPPASYNGNEKIFFKNIEEFKPFSDIVFFSDFPWKNSLNVEDPLSVIDFKNNRFTDLIGLWTFYKALSIAVKFNLDYFMTLESDCRFFKKEWDYNLFKTAIENDAYCCGSLNISKPNNDLDCFNYLKDRYEIIKSNGVNENIEYKNFPVLLHNLIGDKNKCYMWTNGAFSIYNTNVILNLIGSNLTDIVENWYAWDLDVCKLIVDKLGFEEAKRRIIHYQKVASNVASVVTLKFCINNKNNYEAVHPVKTKWKPCLNNESYRFYHGGDLGDIIYALPSMKVLGGGELILGNKDKLKSITNQILAPREFFTVEKYNFIRPLLEKISYLTKISYSDQEEDFDYNFNEFRYFWNDPVFREKTKINRLIDANLDFVGMLNHFDDRDGWIKLNSSKKIARFVIARSERYQDNDFDWNSICEKIKNDCVFVGLKSEHEKFCKIVGDIPFYKVNDALELAEIINGCEIFIGNQSFPMSLALAMNKSVIQEYCDYVSDCLFKNRSNFKTKENYIELFK